MVIVSLLLLFVLAFPVLSDGGDDKTLQVIQGLYQEGVYTAASQKCMEYLQKGTGDDPYREKVIRIMIHSLYKAGDREGFLNALQFLKKEKLSPETAKEVFILGMKLFEENPEGMVKVVEFYLPYAPEEEKEKLYLKLADIYYKDEKWEEILKLPETKGVNIYRVVALYKLGRYGDVVSFTEELGKFLPEDREKVLYYRGLSLFRTGQEEKGIAVLEAISFKTPEIVKLIASYYLREKDYLKARKYLRILSLEEGYKDYAYYYLGVIYDLKKDYKKAGEFYGKASRYDTKYGKLASQRLEQLKEAGVLDGDKYFTVRIILLSEREKAEAFLKEKAPENCFVKQYKEYYGVYCGRFKSGSEAEKEKERLKKAGFKDSIIQQINAQN
ncbi:MAG: hypothetical protein GXN94_04665 [Aquificae bacterium]|nr:hypothetical protein [Aquificota bacterium]